MYLVMQLFAAPFELLLTRNKSKTCFCYSSLFFKFYILFTFLIPDNGRNPSL